MNECEHEEEVREKRKNCEKKEILKRYIIENGAITVIYNFLAYSLAGSGETYVWVKLDWLEDCICL